MKKNAFSLFFLGLLRSCSINPDFSVPEKHEPSLYPSANSNIDKTISESGKSFPSLEYSNNLSGPTENSSVSETKKSVLDKINDSFKTADFSLLSKPSKKDIEQRNYKKIVCTETDGYSVLVSNKSSKTLFSWSDSEFKGTTLYFLDSDDYITEIYSEDPDFSYCGTTVGFQKEDEEKEFYNNTYKFLNDYGFDDIRNIPDSSEYTKGKIKNKLKSGDRILMNTYDRRLYSRYRLSPKDDVYICFLVIDSDL